MSQIIKDLKQQMEKVKIDGFTIRDYKKGDYGYNIVYGLLDDQIEVSFTIPYQSKKADATKEISKTLEKDIKFVRFIREKLIPKDCSMIKFIDGEWVGMFEIGITINDHSIEIPISWIYWIKNHPSYKPPISYSLEQVTQNIKTSVKKYHRNLQILLNSKEFHYENYSLVAGLKGKKDLTRISRNLKINGSAFGTNCSFIVKDFENANIKKYLNQQLKNLKNKLSGKKTKDESNALIDLRNYTELVAALKKEDRMSNGIFKNETQKKKIARNEFCKTTLIPLAKKIFSEVNARFIDWQIGEELSWNELFPDNFFADNDYDDIKMLTILLDIGRTGKYIWGNNVITTSGIHLTNKRAELLKLGQDVDHNLRNTYMEIECDNLILNKDNKIIFSAEIANDELAKKYALKRIKNNVERLTHNIKIFKSNENKYKANAMMAIYYDVLGEKEKAKNYKKVVESIKRKIDKTDEKIEHLLNGIKD
ncbi:MAG: hypothetical protein KIG16_04990 [Eubacteriales bacterium]|nr:hypothetical protein [Eubacteriales bacterium]